MERVVDLYLNNAQTRKRWENFLIDLGLHNFSESEVDVIDHTLGLIDDDGKLVGTGSVAGNVLKYIGVCNRGAVPGARFNKIVSALQQYLFAEQLFHSFVFTKAKYASSFEHLGFNNLAQTKQAAFLESGVPTVEDYLAAIPQIDGQKDKAIAAIVLNANPFTLGHRYLVERASRENDYVYLFVVKADVSLFTTAERMKLVKAGTADLKNVCVVSGSDYMVSSATFPAYFLPATADIVDEQTQIDAQVFKKRIAPSLAITRRYLGTEPFSKTTSHYNQTLQHELEPEIAVKIIPRRQTAGKVITATRVRQKLKDNDLTTMAELLPQTTMEFINDRKTILQNRIKKGMKIDGN